VVSPNAPLSQQPYARILADLHRKSQGTFNRKETKEFKEAKYEELLPTEEQIASQNQFYTLTEVGRLTIMNGGSNKIPGLLNEDEIMMRGDRKQNKVILEPRSFLWLLEHMLPVSERVLGCEIWIPDTAIFEGGKPKLVVKTERDGCLVKYKKLPGLSDLRKIFAIVSRERKKEIGYFEQTQDIKSQENNF